MFAVSLPGVVSDIGLIRGAVDIMEASFSCETEDLTTTSLMKLIHVDLDSLIHSCISCVLVPNLNMSS